MFKKVILLLLVLLLLLVPCVSVFATSVEGDSLGDNIQGDFIISEVYENTYDIVESVIATKVSDTRTRLNVRLKGSMFVNNVFTMVVKFDLLDSIDNVSTKGTYKILTDLNWTIRKDQSEFFRTYTVDSYVMKDYATKIVETDISGNDTIAVSYDGANQTSDQTYRSYYNLIALKCLVSDTSYNIYFDGLTDLKNVNFEVYVGETLMDIEENKAEVGGNSALSGAADSMNSADKSGGFFNALKRLASAMAYPNTASVWKVPSIVLPKINGVMEETKLTDEMTIDFRQYVRMIPEDILKLIQGLLTIALIIYCFKELYNILSYLFTLRGGGADE